ILKRFAKHLLRFLQIDNVYAVALAEDVFLHLRVPATDLVAEVNTGLQQFFHRNGYQTTVSLLIGLCTRRDRRSALEQPIQIATMDFEIQIATGALAFLRRKQPRRLRASRKLYRFENWKRLRAPFCPYFLRSLMRGSRVIKPACFSVGRRSALYSSNARVMP